MTEKYFEKDLHWERHNLYRAADEVLLFYHSKKYYLFPDPSPVDKVERLVKICTRCALLILVGLWIVAFNLPESSAVWIIIPWVWPALLISFFLAEIPYRKYYKSLAGNLEEADVVRGKWWQRYALQSRGRSAFSWLFSAILYFPIALFLLYAAIPMDIPSMPAHQQWFGTIELGLLGLYCAYTSLSAAMMACLSFQKKATA